MSYDNSKVGELPNALFDQLLVIYRYSWVTMRGNRKLTEEKRRAIRDRLIRLGHLPAPGNMNEVFDFYNACIARHASLALPPSWTLHTFILPGAGRISGFVQGRNLALSCFAGEAEDGRLKLFDSASAVHSYTRRILDIIHS